MQPKPIKPITASEAALNTQQSLGEKTRSRFARGIARGALHIANMRPAKVLAKASEVKALIDGASKLHGWERHEGQNTVLQIAFLSQPEKPCKVQVVDTQ